MTSFATGQCYECPDVVQAAGNANNWHTAIGTGPYIVTDWVDSAQATLVANPNFWGVDERYPKQTSLHQTARYSNYRNVIYHWQRYAPAKSRAGSADI